MLWAAISFSAVRPLHRTLSRIFVDVANSLTLTVEICRKPTRITSCRTSE